MRRKMTISLDTVYKGRCRAVGKRRMSSFTRNMAQSPDVVLDDGYRAMAADKDREAEAMEWCNALAGDMADAAR